MRKRITKKPIHQAFENLENAQPLNIFPQLATNMAQIKREFNNTDDLSTHHIESEALNIALLYINGITDQEGIRHVCHEITSSFSAIANTATNTADYYIALKTSILSSKAVEDSCFEALFEHLLSGHTIILVDGIDRFIAVYTYGVEGRVVEEPTAQTVIKGPKEAFTEKINMNIALVRKRINSRALKTENLVLGYVTHTKITLMYIDKIAKKEIVDEVKKRLSKIKIDGILDSTYIEELIKDNKYCSFPTFLSSERPDAITAGLLEGRVAIFVDGTAYVLIVPALFFDFFQSSEDYYTNFIVASVTRVLRYIAFFLTLLVPASYIALTNFHQEIIPTPLLISIASQREGVPFPALIEVLLMEISFELLREAGIRMPRAIGPSISIVGALVLGQAAVEAGIISAAMIIVVSITAISSFVIPNYAMSNSVRLSRFALIFLSGIFGLYGVFMGLIGLVVYLCHLKSMTIPYLTPIAPKMKGGLQDAFLRNPLWKQSCCSSGIRAISHQNVVIEQPIPSTPINAWNQGDRDEV